MGHLHTVQYIGREIHDELLYINKIYYYAVGTRTVWYSTCNYLGAIPKVLYMYVLVGNFKNSCHLVLEYIPAVAIRYIPCM